MTKFKSISSILLFALVVPFIMNYSLSSGKTPYWLFSTIFLGLFLYILLDVVNLEKKIYFRGKSILLWFLVIIVLGSAFLAAIVKRHETSPIFEIHDIILQQESAMQFLLSGKNPYSETYFGTPLENFFYSDTEKNPALYHFVMEPFYLIFAYPFYFTTIPLLGFFDGRIPLFFLFFFLLYLAWKIAPDDEGKLSFVALLAFNPAMLPYTLEGRSDVFMYAFLLFGLFLLDKKKNLMAGVMIALSMLVKQSAWPLFPILLIYYYLKSKKEEKIKQTNLAIIKLFKNLVPFILTTAVIAGPFILWDFSAYSNSTVFYLAGSIPTSYPISGYGFGMLLHELGIISDLHASFPFTLFQLLAAVPFLVWAFFSLKKNFSVKNLILLYGLFLFIFWYFSRYFNNSHIGYLSMVFITWYFWPEVKTADKNALS